MKRRICFSVSLLLTLAATSSPSQDQFKERVERNNHLLQEIQHCVEGFAGALDGAMMVYHSFRTDPLPALITRATSGAMAVTWKTQNVPKPLQDKEVTFVVMAGMYGQEPSGFKFQMLVNEIPRFTITTTAAETWQVDGKGGGRLRYYAVVNDKYNDVFGYLCITVPSDWVEPGEPVRMSIVGEKADQNAWIMIFQTPDVIAYHKELVANETFCDVSIEAVESGHTITIRGPSAWTGKEVTLTMGGNSVGTQRVDALGGGSFAAFRVGKKMLLAPLTLSLNGSVLFALDSLFNAVTTTLVYPHRLVSLTALAGDARAWRLRYQATYHPALGASLTDLSKASNGRGTHHLILSTHQDIAWMDSPENCVQARDEKIITPLLDIMRDNPAYCFDLEDVLCLREYLERHPGKKEEIHQRIREGRLGVGASFNQPYEDLCSGEMLVRQFTAGRRWLRTNFPGCDTKTYWNPDVPARTLQMPQVMRRAGVNYLVMSRFEKGLYTWFSPDGSGVTAFSPGHYGDFKARMDGAPFEQAAGFVATLGLEWMKRVPSSAGHVPLVSMADMSGPDSYDAFLGKWSSLESVMNEDGTTLPLLLPLVRHATAEQYLGSVTRDNPSLIAIEGERPNIWLYIHGPTHHQAISAKREADGWLTAAEIFSTVDALLRKSFREYPQRELTEAWEAQLYPDHGWGGKNGDITDSTFKARYESARTVSRDIASRAVTSIASRVKTEASRGTPMVLFNSLSWRRSAPVQVSASWSVGAVPNGVVVVDAGGRTVPSQIVASRRHPDGSLQSAEIAFVAQAVPSVGYATFYLQPSPQSPAPTVPRMTMPKHLESSFYDIRLSRGGVEQIFDRELGKEILSPGKFLAGELFTMQSVGEDAGEWAEPQQPTMEGFDKLGNHATTWQLVESGPVRDVVEASTPLQHARVVQRVTLYRALKRIDFETSLLAWDGTKYREFRLAFPVCMGTGQVSYEVPFGVVEVGKSEMKGAAGERYTQEVSRVRPRSIQNWIGVSGAQYGVTLSSSVAVWDYRDPTDSTLIAPLLQPVLLASRRSCHGEGPWYLQAGDHQFRFSLTSHAPGWAKGEQFGVGANTPFLVVVGPVRRQEADLPSSRSFVSLDDEDIVLSTIKKCEDDEAVIVRLVEKKGKDATATLRFMMPLRNVEETSIIEEGAKPVQWSGDRVPLRMGSNAIQTYRLFPTW